MISALAYQQTFVFDHATNQIPTYNVPPPLSLLKYRDKSTKTYEFGASIATSIYIHPPVSIAVANHSTLQWKIKIHSPGALSLSLIFDQWQTPLGASLYIMNRNGQRQYLNLSPDKTQLATWPMTGDTLYVVYESSSSFQLIPHLHISRVIYGYLPMPFLDMFSIYESSQEIVLKSNPNRSGRCNIDYACDAIGSYWSKEASSIAILLTNENQRYCTGAFINNIEQDGRQLLLTANHCIIDATTSMTDMVLLNYQKPFCDSSNTFKKKLEILRGLVLQNSSSVSDYAIFEVQERIPEEYDAYLAGWTTEAKPDWPLVGIHHPQGDFKKLSVYNSSLKLSCWDECPKKSHWRVEKWTRGTTESGSSGSPLFDAHHRIVGQLHGGRAACWNKNGYDMYGSFRESWQLGLSDVLDPYSRTSKQQLVKLDGIYLNTLRNRDRFRDRL
ncbi:trypsin-like cysteine/serine peptidase domain-containing protein [Blakeslea trispora]|nr:trypsin-like cysteine/serine peptidase domain-containing protein [Blakeslea trispora]